MTRPTLLSILVLCTASGQFAVAQTNLLQNPSFEQPFVGSSFHPFSAGSTIGTGWFVQQSTTNAAVLSNGWFSGLTWWAPTAGNQFLYVGNSIGGSTISQQVTLEASKPYRLTFDLSSFHSNSGLDFSAQLNVDILKDGVSILGSPATFTRPSFSNFQTQTLNFNSMSSGEYTLIIQSPAGFGTNVDNFNLVLVPEPTMLTLSVFAVGFFCHRTRQFKR